MYIVVFPSTRMDRDERYLSLENGIVADIYDATWFVHQCTAERWVRDIAHPSGFLPPLIKRITSADIRRLEGVDEK